MVNQASIPEYVTVEEARKILKVGKAKMAKLINKKVLLAETNPLDGREKLLKRDDVLALARKGRVE